MSLKDAFAGMTPGGAKAKGSAPVPVHRSESTPKVGSAPGHLVGMNSKFQELSDEVATLRKGKGAPTRVRLDLCDEGDHHPYPINPERVMDLVPSIKAAGQTSPALVKPKEDGRYLIIAGRHRKLALLELGETEWDVVFREAPTTSLKRIAFFDNLLAPQLSDYERFLGIRKLRDEEGIGLEAIAEESGLSKSTVGRLMRFAELPKEAIAIVERRHKAFSALMADQLAILCKKNPERVTAAFQKVFDEEMNMTQAVAWALMPDTKPNKEKPPVFVFKAGKAKFATMTIRGQAISVQIAPGISPDVVKDAIQAVLAQKAKEHK